MSLSKLKWQQHLNHLRYLHEELEVVEAVQYDGAEDFQTYYEQFCALHHIDIAQLNSEHQEHIQQLYGTLDNGDEEETDPAQKNEIDKMFAKVFRKLAVHLHPDKLLHEADEEEKNRKITMFQNAVEALETKRYYKLMEYAHHYNIEVPAAWKVQSQWVREEIEMVEREIASGKETYTYQFFECDSDAERDELIRKFLKQLFDYSLDQEPQ